MTVSSSAAANTGQAGRSRLVVVESGLRCLDTGHAMYAFKGVGHSDADIIAAVRDEEMADLNGYFLLVSDGRWGWSPRMKNCGDHDRACDSEGEWHRHYSPNWPRDEVTVVTLYRWKPSAFADSRVIEVGGVS